MKFYLTALGAMVATITVAIMAPAPAQEQSYETRLYMARPQEKPDENFGLPTFGLPGADLPQKTTAPAADAEATRTAPGTEARQSDADFFNSAGHFANDFPDVALPSDRRQTSNQVSPSTSNGTSSLSMDSTPSSTTDDTPLYTTSDGMTTGDIGSSSTTKSMRQR